MSDKIEIENFDEFQKMLSELNDKVKMQIIKKGFTEASKPLIQQARANINSARIQKSLGVKMVGETALIGARKFKPYYGQLAPIFEKGTKERSYISKSKKLFKTEKKVHRTGKIKKTGFWSRAIESSEPTVIKNIETVFIETMEKILSKFNK